MRLTIYCLLLIAIFFTACRHKGSHQHAFYYWKTRFFSDTTNARMASMGVDKLYIRYMDVDWSEARQMPVPRGQLSYSWMRFPYITAPYVPVVFITNRTFENMSSSWCDTLAARLTRRIAGISGDIENAYIQEYTGHQIPYSSDTGYHRRIDSLKQSLQRLRANSISTEIQIDCDWTATTRNKYFLFLSKFRALNPNKTISATVRLYPYKYTAKMGVPPVDRAMLMCYNLGKIQDSATRNSILDVAELKKYFNGSDYPLPVDIALPVFGWYAWFRNGHFTGIVHEDESFVADTALFRPGGNAYTISADTVIGDNYYREGDVLRHEMPAPADVQAAADFVVGKVPGYGTITFFDWNDHSISFYEKAIQAVFARH